VTSVPADLVRSAWKAGRFLVQEAGNALATLIATRRSDRVLVCTHEEARRAEPIAGDTPVSVVPHFVEERPHYPDRAEARRELGLDGCRVVGVLGYIHRRKGHDFLVEALPHLPGDVVAVFVGRPGRDSPGFAAHLRTRARELGVADRVRITGYVDEATLDRYLAATDLALCPFREASASGSLSTWIASETPVLASDLPLFDEYEAIVPGSMAVAPSLAPEPLARAIEAALNRPSSTVRPRLRRLRRMLTLDRVIHEHRHVYRLAVRANLTAKDA
jgi:glycosyltransferase involved in cell wall biosynthesis